ncbi:MAG: hypothetical protein A2Y12_07380 [Planctomycetes bacterium GWF2_42_9]|nr:MAG: hypothetical protein A2Y12_07380 [Planctomycetes bacterium GWF2_42_9]HAL44528.1 hypothetical protein [Phycisphaerales bacterium]
MNRKIVLLVCLNILLVINFVNAQTETSALPVVKAMTFNIRVDTILDGPNGWAFRRDKVLDIMRNQNADIIGIQEGSHRQVEQIRDALPDYTHYSPGPDSGMAGESCSIYFKSAGFTLKDSGTFWFSDTPDEQSGGWPKVCSWVYLTDKKTGVSFYVYNCHLSPFLAQGARQREAELLAERIATRKTNDPVILLGDFNMNVGNKAMDYLLNADGQTAFPKMTDAWQTLNDTKGPKYDHIILNEDAKAIDIKVDYTKASDHYAIIAEIQINVPKKTPIVAEQSNVNKVSVN